MKIKVFTDIEAARVIKSDLDTLSKIEVKSEIAERQISHLMDELFTGFYDLMTKDAADYYATMPANFRIEDHVETNEVEI